MKISYRLKVASSIAASAMALISAVLASPKAPASHVPHSISGSKIPVRKIHWIKMPLRSSPDAHAAAFPGGEGAQWPRGPVAVSPADPNFLLLPIDVGGLYRSLDGGKHWRIAMVGWNARGANRFAIDPRNARHVIGIASNSMEWQSAWGPSPHGLYLSTDQAASWQQVLAISSGFGGTVAYDPTSFLAEKGICTRAYYLSPHQGLFRSNDGGRAWTRLNQGPVPGVLDRDWTLGGGMPASLAVDGRSGTVYLGGAGGLFRSNDQGAAWTLVRKTDVYGLSLAPDGTLFVSGLDRVSVSRDRGRTWMALPCAGLDTLGGKPVQDLAISPVDPRRMLCWVAGDNWNWKRYVTQDGGAIWKVVTLNPVGAFLPTNERQGYATWSPTDPDVAWSLGGDWVSRSDDGGNTFHWSNNGYNGVMVGGLFNFTLHAPDTVLLGFQDYNGAFTTDGGHTWNYRDISGKGWGGQEYGAGCVDGQVMWTGDAESWGTPRRLRLSRDGGRTWAFVPGTDGKPLEFHGADVSLSDPRDADVLFASDLRSADRGKTWARMTGCEGVFTCNPTSGALYGRKGSAVVCSKDHGASWTRVADVEGGFDDLAVDGKRGCLYVASQERLKRWAAGQWNMLETPRDQYGRSRVTTVAVDPGDPAVVYVGGPRNIYASHATICRSTDSGATWTNLTVTTPLGNGVEDGPHEVGAIRVHPVTHEAWAAGQCFGLWRIAPPAPHEKGLPAAEASAPPAIPPQQAAGVK